MACDTCGAELQKGKCNVCEMLATGETPGGTTTTGWPMVSKAISVHKEQAAEANELMKVHNIGVKFDGKGDAHVPNRGERKRALKLLGRHDNDGGYGDA
jgi:hypothetical protein